MKKILLLIAVAFCSLSINAEEKELINSKCYRGSAELGYSIGAIHYPKINRFEINTSHGYQFNPYLYLGAGAGLHFYSTFDGALYSRSKKVDVPLFGHIKANFTKTRVSPYAEVKLGYHITVNSGLYAFAGLGCRFATVKKQGVNLSLGYSCSVSKFSSYIGTKYYGSSSAYCEAISIKLAYDF